MLWGTPEHLEPTPHMGPAHWDMIWKSARTSTTLEWGSGGSTFWVVMNGSPFWWLAVEHQQEWYRSVWSALSHYLDDDVCVELLFASSPEFYTSPPVTPAKFRNIIVDGKWRNECLLATQEYLAPGGKVFLHDAERNYQIPGFLKEVHRSTDPDWVVNPKCELAVFEMKE